MLVVSPHKVMGQRGFSFAGRGRLGGPAFEQVVGISLGAPATMRFRRRVRTQFERIGVPLPPRGAYHLSGKARHEWEHSIAEMEETRWSVTFRSLSERSLVTRGA